ncbi:thyrostimulin alpha-2 subunit-like [Tubulanus polymorphus]|uniref:thyrostimulin alpha-2 subunit-like n=1 Tax=Tubulanus polymorphus TaxID=672921 RepID=UPI003DA34A29
MNRILGSMNYKHGCWCNYVILIITLVLCGTQAYQHTWEKPGCYRIGVTRKIRIPGCYVFDSATNACRGFCSSYSFPSTYETLVVSPNQIITTRGTCCNMLEAETIQYNVPCLGGTRTIYMKSAVRCECSFCSRH